MRLVLRFLNGWRTGQLQSRWAIPIRSTGLGRCARAMALAEIMISAGTSMAGPAAAQMLTPEEASAAMIDSSPELYSLLEAEFPDDYRRFTVKMAEWVNAGLDRETLGSRAIKTMTKIRWKYAPYVRMGSDALHAQLIESNIAYYQDLLAHDRHVCNAVAINGPTVLLNYPDTPPLLTRIDPQAALLMRTAASGMQAPVSRRTVTEDDWTALDQAMLASGATEAEVQAMIDVDPASPDLCPGLIKLMQELNAIDTEQFRAIRAEFLANLAAG